MHTGHKRHKPLETSLYNSRPAWPLLAARSRNRYSLVLTVMLLQATASFADAPPAAFPPDQIEFFENEVRPLLVDACGECHGPDTQEADLRLDSRAALLKGGATGPVVVPGDPEQSLLIRAVRQTGDLEMPPDSKLSDEQIAVLERWVKAGAPWPIDDTTPADHREVAQQKHWAFQPIGKSSPPVVQNAAWCRTPIDAFLLAEIESQGLAPSLPADRRTLIRRVTYDLTGLPPTPAEVEEFINDADPEAYAKLVEHLLASPQYGEQWARHWLDVARYSDTKGYVYAREERFFLHAAAYRDWVVRAFNDDLPYNEFLLLQLAADQVAPDDRSALAAMGYLTLGRRFLGVTHDIIDDQIDVVSRGMLGLTVACARCHDHKYDPIPTDDYYALYGVFRNCRELAVPIAESAAGGESRADFEQELQKRQQALDEAMAVGRKEAAARVRQRVTDYLLAQQQLEKYPEESFNQIYSTEDIIPAFVRRWQTYLEMAAEKGDPVFVPWHRFANLPAKEFADRAAAIARQIGDESTGMINPLVAKAFEEPPTSMREVAERYGQILHDIDQEWQRLSGNENASALADPSAEAVRAVLYDPHSPCVVPDEAIVSNELYFDTATIENLWKLQGEVDRWLIQSPEAPTYAVALVDRDFVEEPRVFRRGNPASKGNRVPRQFLKLLSEPNRKPFAHGSGRLEMARAIVADDNPLTARVWANRVWMHHFGTGLVQTPSDFGLRSEAPSHPKLLDWLARQLISQGWSTKSLHRLIVLSAAYQQRSDHPQNAANVKLALELDPQNRLLWRMNDRRLSFEEWRDTLLAVSGELDWRMGGRAAELFPDGADNLRRTLYGLVDRQFLTTAMRTFDFANPDLHTPQRSETTVSQQALFAMNHPFVANRARAIAAQLERTGSSNTTERVRQLFRAIYQREPTEAQQHAAHDFLVVRASESPIVRTEAMAWQYGLGSLSESEGRVEFQPLPHFDGAAWQGGSQWPDAKLGWVQLTADGGHAGNDLEHAAIRRWTAPHGGTVNIESSAVHEVAPGDGIRCWIVSSRLGVLTSAILHNRQQSLNIEKLDVRAGDTIDFVVDYHANLNSDQFLWKAKISDLPAPIGASNAVSSGQTWDSSRDFAGNAPVFLNRWEQLAHVLLLSNELMFVD